MRYFWAALLAGYVAFAQAPVYQNPDAPLDKRVDDLLSRMTTEEKVLQMLNDAPAIDRLGVPAYNWWNECLHGVARAGRATVFPMPIGLAATWDPEMLFRMATAISDEARAKNNEFIRKGKRTMYQGLTFWTPNINLVRDPRWGRGMEAYGEDPYLVGRMAVQFIKGLQGNDPKYLKVVATAKHFAVHSGPESSRHSFDAKVDEEDLKSSYLPQFEAAVRQGGAASVMCAYNRVNGEAACASPTLLENTLRKQWGFSGYVVSDCGAVGDIFRGHNVAPNMAAAAALAVKNGTDLDCGSEYRQLIPALEQKLITEPEIDTALRRLLTARFRLGMFDPPERVPFTKLPISIVESAAHQTLALEAARKSIVLLKNEGNVLPLKKSIKTLAVIGPNADNLEVLLGNYNGDPTSPITPLEGLKRKLGTRTKVIYAQGSDLADELPSLETVPADVLFTSEGADRKPGLQGEYFNTPAFNGQVYRAPGRDPKPAAEGVAPLFTRVDPQINFKWWDGAPRNDMDDDNFGVRWTGFLAPKVTGKYKLGGVGMNAFEIFFNGKQIARANNRDERNYATETVEMEAGKSYAIRVEFHEVINDADMRLVWTPPGRELQPAALEAVKQAEAVVLFLGLSPRLEGEEMRVQVPGFKGGDRVELGLPAAQQALMEKVVALGKPTVLVLLNGSALSVEWAKSHVPALVDAWYPGQAGGAAIADVLFGDYNPAGRLPVTFYQSADQLPAFEDYSMKGRTYRYFQGEPLFPFGFGLSYTTFSYRKLEMPDGVKANQDVTVSVEVRNMGKVAGEEVVQAYVKHDNVRSLAGFQRVMLGIGERKVVKLVLRAKELPKDGVAEISVGGQQPTAAVPGLVATLSIQ
ncbi:MAG: glycoside hydrolase family 3 C-terminal domain-containing protein [Candidatus Solibacter sp.]